MKDELKKLQKEFEELEKHLSTVTSANFTFSELSAMRIYLENVQKYILSLTNAFSQHQISCQEYSTQINGLQEQINQINAKLEEGTAINLDEINLQIETLTLNLDDVIAQLCAIRGGSDNSIFNLDNEISDLQTEIGYITDQIEAINTEISTQNTHIGDLQSQVNNLSSTQNTLTTAQSSLSSRVSGIDNRLTTAEANISTLTGGVDVAYLDERITNLENTNGPTCAHETYSFHNATPTNYTLYTREYYFSCSKEEMLYQKMKLTYTSQGTGTLTITFFEEQVELPEQITVDLAKHPYEYEFSRQFLPTKKANNIMVKAVSTTEITYETFDLWLFGKNVVLYNYDQDLKVECFNGCAYLTRYYENDFKYGKFSDLTQIDLNNLPNSRVYHDANGYARYIKFMPHLRSTYPYETYSRFNDESIYFEELGNNHYISSLASQSLDSTTKIFHNDVSVSGGELNCSWCTYDTAFHIRNSLPRVNNPHIKGSNYDYESLPTYKTGEWFFVTPVVDNFKTMDTGPLKMSLANSIALHEDGYFYFIMQIKPVKQVLKLCKGGNYATAYQLNDETINVYISYNTYVKKIILLKTGTYKYEISSEEIIDGCSCVYELLNTHLIKKTSNGWVIEQITTQTDETEQPNT